MTWLSKRCTSLSISRSTSCLLYTSSAKVRVGPPIDDEEDYSFPIWAGVVPLEMTAGTPIDDLRVLPNRTVPEYARGYSRKR